MDRTLQIRQLSRQAAVIPSRAVLHGVALFTTSSTRPRPVGHGASADVVTEGLAPETPFRCLGPGAYPAYGLSDRDPGDQGFGVPAHLGRHDLLSGLDLRLL